MSQELVIYEEDQGIARLWLNRPDARNALNRPLLEALAARVAALDSRRDLRAVIVSAEGDKAFCAGADLRERMAMNDDETRAFIALIRGTITAIERLSMPVIAALNGIAFGGGLELALACDLRVAQSQAQLGLTEVSVGIIPGAGGTQRLARLIGLGRAKELILTARRIDAQTALSLGIVHRVVPAAQLMSAADELAREIARNAPLAVRQAKFAMDMGYGLPIDAALMVEWKCYEQILHTFDRKEGLRAFSEKRAPEYRGE